MIKNVVLCVLLISFFGLKADCNLESFITSIQLYDLSIRGTVIEEMEEEYAYNDVKLPTRLKVKIDQKYYGIETLDTIEIIKSGNSMFHFFSFHKGDQILLNLNIGESAYLLYSSSCPCTTNALKMINDTIHELDNYHYQEFERNMQQIYGPFHTNVFQIRYGNEQFMKLKQTAHQTWDFVLKDLNDGAYWIYDIQNGKILTKEIHWVYQGNYLKTKKYYSNQQVKIVQCFEGSEFFYETQYYEDGTRKLHKSIENGELEYLFSYWENGNLYQSISKKDSIYSYQQKNQQGKLEYNGVLDNQQYVGHVTKYDTSGQIIEQYIQQKEGIHGQHYQIKNNYLYVYQYQHGVLNGEYFSYKIPVKYSITKNIKWENGKLTIQSKLPIATQGSYVNGQKNGKWTYYTFYNNKRELDRIIDWKENVMISEQYFSQEF